MATSEETTLPESSRALLARVEATGLSLQAIHDAAGLPSGWISKARRGLREPTAPGWAKLREWLDRYERRALPPGAPPPDAAAPSPGPAPSSSPSIPADLANAIDQAKTADDLIASLRRVGIAGVRGTIPQNVGKLALDLVKETRLTLERLAAKEGAANTVREALDVLTPRERALVDALRKAFEGPGLKPGEASAPPPPGDDALPLPPRIFVASTPEGAWEALLVAEAKAPAALAAFRAVAGT